MLLRHGLRRVYFCVAERLDGSFARRRCCPSRCGHRQWPQIERHRSTAALKLGRPKNRLLYTELQPASCLYAQPSTIHLRLKRPVVAFCGVLQQRAVGFSVLDVVHPPEKRALMAVDTRLFLFICAECIVCFSANLDCFFSLNQMLIKSFAFVRPIRSGFAKYGLRGA